ncbi:MAG: RpoL/Rpb11 RNA polymerase subunit family protein [Candidatus Odinarchaeota archaeon]
MAKKKSKPKEEDELDELDDDLLEDVDSIYPSLGRKNDKIKEGEQFSTEDDEILEEEYRYEMEELPKQPEYKYLNLTLSKGKKENDYKLAVEGQSPGFLNILVKHLLKIEGVKSAAYKVTRIDPPEVFIRIEEGYKIKQVLRNGIESLKNDVNEVQKLFKILMK